MIPTVDCRPEPKSVQERAYQEMSEVCQWVGVQVGSVSLLAVAKTQSESNEKRLNYQETSLEDFNHS